MNNENKSRSELGQAGDELTDWLLALGATLAIVLALIAGWL